MSYVLTRILAFAVLWGLTCVLMAVMGPTTATACYLAAVCWALIGTVYLLSARRIRLETEPSQMLPATGVFDSDNLD